MRIRHLPILLPLALGWAHADTLYKCTDESGHTTYTNQKGASKNCKILSQDQPISTFTSPKGRAATPTPGDFPRVGTGEQKARDSDRRSILEKELAAEQQNLELAKKALAEQEGLILPEERMAKGGIQGGKVEERIQRHKDQVQIHERNIEALKKELANIR